MNGDHILYVFVEEPFYVFAEIVDENELGWLVIIELILVRDSIIKVFMVISAFRAQIVYFVPFFVLFEEEALHIFHMIAIYALHANRGESHCYDPVGDIGEIEIVAALLIAILLQRDHSSCKVPSFKRLQIVTR